MSYIISKELADEKIKGGWLRVWAGFTALAVSEEVTKSALNELIDKLDKDPRVKIYMKDFGTLERREKPLKGIDVGYAGTAEVEFAVKDFETLIQAVIEYGPSAVEMLEPTRLNISAGEAQNVINTVAQMMHLFAEAGLGGMIFVRGNK